MDPFTVFSLVGTALQFVDCGSRFLMLARNLYESSSDTSESHKYVVSVAQDIEKVLPDFSPDFGPDDNNSGLCELTNECRATCNTPSGNSAQSKAIVSKSQKGHTEDRFSINLEGGDQGTRATIGLFAVSIKS